MKTSMARWLAAACLPAVVSAGVLAKLPPPTSSPEAQAKAAQAKEKAAWSAKVAAYELCKTEDRVAQRYYKDAKAAGRSTHPPEPTPPCTDPGKFSPTASAGKPIEAAGAHSPAATATTPPGSVKNPTQGRQGKQ